MPRWVCLAVDLMLFFPVSVARQWWIALGSDRIEVQFVAPYFGSLRVEVAHSLCCHSEMRIEGPTN